MLQKLHKNKGGFTLVEIMIVVAIIALLAAIAVPNFLRARKRSQATRILEDLRQVANAIDQLAIEKNVPQDEVIDWDDLRPYFKPGSVLATVEDEGVDIFGRPYITATQTVNDLPRVHEDTAAEFEGIVDENFWAPYGPGEPDASPTATP